MVGLVRARCAGLPPVGLTLGPAYVGGSAVMLRVAPTGPVTALRQVLVDAVGEALGTSYAGAFVPHISLGYGSADRDDDTDLQQWLDARHTDPVDITVGQIALVDQVQDLTARQYRWAPRTNVDLTSGKGQGL